jgi:hypothetical protein
VCFGTLRIGRASFVVVINLKTENILDITYGSLALGLPLQCFESGSRRASMGNLEIS